MPTSIPRDLAKLEALCLPFIRGQALPATAAELMASRFVAYALCEVDYLIDTHDPDTRDETDREATEKWARSSKFHDLEILSTKAGGPHDDEGEVEFVALYTNDEGEHRHHERSTFRRVDGRWYFCDARIVQKPARRDAGKVGRNDPCPCGSGKKYKKCHGAAA